MAAWERNRVGCNKLRQLGRADSASGNSGNASSGQFFFRQCIGYGGKFEFTWIVVFQFESSNSNSSSGFNGPTFGGGPILGVASTSKAKSIRVFYDKNHYNDWLFIYVPQADRGGLLTGPVIAQWSHGKLWRSRSRSALGGAARSRPGKYRRTDRPTPRRSDPDVRQSPNSGTDATAEPVQLPDIFMQ